MGGQWSGQGGWFSHPETLADVAIRVGDRQARCELPLVVAIGEGRDAKGTTSGNSAADEGAKARRQRAAVGGGELVVSESEDILHLE